MNLPSDLLALIFFYLKSLDIVRCRRVCSLWLNVIDSTTSHFKILELPEKSIKEWKISINFFNQKSQNQLQKVSLPSKLVINVPEMTTFIHILSKSKATLSSLSLSLPHAGAATEFFKSVQSPLSQLSSLSIRFSSDWAGLNARVSLMRITEGSLSWPSCSSEKPLAFLSLTGYNNARNAGRVWIGLPKLLSQQPTHLHYSNIFTPPATPHVSMPSVKALEFAIPQNIALLNYPHLNCLNFHKAFG